MKNYKYIDHTADLGIEVRALTLEALFMNIGIAIFDTQVSGDYLSVKEISISISGESIEELFIDWCRELLYNFSVHDFIPLDYSIKIENLKLTACLKGDSFDAKKHKIKTEIKNVTYHDLKIGKDNDHYTATVIFDV